MTTTGARTRDELFATLTEAVTEILPDVAPTDIRPTMHLRDLGADSVDRVEIIVTVLERLSLQEPLSSFSDLTDIDAMLDLVQERISS